MAKILKDAEILQIINRVPRELNDEDYRVFLYQLAEIVCSHFGGDVGLVTGPDDIMDCWTVGIHWNEDVPEDGGIYREYDVDADFGESDLEEQRDAGEEWEATRPRGLNRGIIGHLFGSALENGG